ncbi:MULTISPECIES: SIMPL domain-containing protein [unclassified Rhizobium]|uniref:SIMPL domain-containing protein n=1 Tax=unclassified Rhizobium TaxID=2613769 RepID=UPI00381611E1
MKCASIITAVTAILSIALVVPVHAEEKLGQGAGLIRVVGEGQVLRSPDLAVVRLTVLRQAGEASQAVSASTDGTRKVIAALVSAGIGRDDMQSVDFQISPRFDFTPKPDGTLPSSTIVGYDARNTLLVRVHKVSEVGDVLDVALKNGVNEGGSVDFIVDDVAGAVDEARKIAVAAAAKSAGSIAQASNLKLGPIVAIEDQPAATVFPYASTEARFRSASLDGGVPVVSGKNVVTARVAVSYLVAR